VCGGELEAKTVVIRGNGQPEKAPFISVILADAGFRENTHVLHSLRNQSWPANRYELIWVEYHDRVPLSLNEIRDLRIITLNRTDTPYHMSVCFNAGIRESRGDIVVIMDADVVTGPDLLASIGEAHCRCRELVMYVRRWDEPESAHTGDIDLDHLAKVCQLVNPMNFGGCISVRREWLLEVDGYEEDPVFSGLSANAMDLYTRLNNLGLHIRWHPRERIYHPWHPGTRYPSPGYRRQHRVIRHRARSLAVLPVQGLDRSLPRPYGTVYDEVPQLDRLSGNSVFARLKQAVRILVKGR
jgi:hypothetical protein